MYRDPEQEEYELLLASTPQEDLETSQRVHRRQPHPPSSSLLPPFLLRFLPVSKGKRPAHLGDRTGSYTYLHIPGSPIRCFIPRVTTPRGALLCVLLLLLVVPSILVFMALIYGGFPPDFSDIRKAERALPQHDWTWRERVSSRIGGHGETVVGAEANMKYLRFEDHLWGNGFNNVGQEYLVSYHLADTLNRTYVFEDHVWSHIPLPYTLYDFTLRPTRVPMGAFLSGVIDGASVDSFQRTPKRHPAISAEYFEYVCAPRERFEVWYPPTDAEVSAGAPKALESEPYWKDISGWFTARMQMDDVKTQRCVVVRERKKIFNFGFFGSPRILEVFPDLRESPVLKGFEWSPLVIGALERTMRVLFRTKIRTHTRRDSVPVSIRNGNATATPTLRGLLAVHLRRGDFSRHCKRLSGWGAGYLGFNTFPSLIDRFHPPAFRDGSTDVSGGASTGDQSDTHHMSNDEKEERERFYMPHCLPEIPEIVERLRTVRREYEEGFGTGVEKKPVGRSDEEEREPRYRLSKVYILTNGWPSWIHELQAALRKDGWMSVYGTPDLENGVSGLPSTDGLGSEGSGGAIAVGDGVLGAEGIGGNEGGRLLPLTKEESAVSVAIDMALAERAEVFVGNGFSSATANIVMLRTARGLPMFSNRFL